MTRCRRSGYRALVATVAVGALAVPAAAAAQSGDRGLPARTPVGVVEQLQGADGCVVDESRPKSKCASARALGGPGPFLGSRAVAVSPDGKNVYVASSSSDAIAIFKRNSKDGTLTQASGAAGCIAQGGGGGCASGAGLDGPNSVAVSPDGENVYATSVDSDAIAVFRRNAKNGALSQAPGDAGCIAEAGAGGCRSGRALDGADVVVVSADGQNVYVGAFFGSAVAVFDREAGGALVQPPGPAGCITAIPDPGCVNGRALGAVEGLAISEDGLSVYAAAAGSNALAILRRDPATGALSQAADGTGCITQSDTNGCTTGRELAGANAVAVSPDDETVYVTSLFSNSITTFARAPGTGELTQLEGTGGCLVYLVAIGCRLGQALEAPEGLGLSPDGRNLYATAFESGAVDVFNRNPSTGDIAQKTLKAGCVAIRTQRNCARGRSLAGASSAVVSPDGKSLYVTAFGSDAVGVFAREK
jgi:DNA-binding beta-propeller fold protein YncE